MWEWLKKQVESSEYAHAHDEIKGQAKEIEASNVSEPVISFVKAFKANPKRFKIKYDMDNYTLMDPAYILTDTKEQLSWRFTLLPRSYDIRRRDMIKTIQYRVVYGAPSFLSDNELRYIIDNMYPYYEDREKRFIAIRCDRMTRLHTKQRKALMKVYCE